jgi:hypothetical protein
MKSLSDKIRYSQLKKKVDLLEKNQSMVLCSAFCYIIKAYSCSEHKYFLRVLSQNMFRSIMVLKGSLVSHYNTYVRVCIKYFLNGWLFGLVVYLTTLLQ